MTFTLNQTFDLLFGSGQPVPERIGFDDRRWFRRPPPLANGVDEKAGDHVRTTSSSDLDQADEILAMRIKASSRRWAKKAGLDQVPEIDLRRHAPPRLPYDVFAASAYITEQAGIYHHLQPVKKAPTAGPGDHSNAAGLRHLDISQADRDEVDAAAARWRMLPVEDSMADLADALTTGDAWSELEPLFESWWVLFCASGEDMLLSRPDGEAGPTVPYWWRHAWRLMAIADEAAAGTVYQLDPERIVAFTDGKTTDSPWFEFEVYLEHLQRLFSSTGPSTAHRESAAQGELGDMNSLSIASPAVVSVLPKVRTPSVGCTLRSLSHHLALLPPVGIVKGRWTPNYTQPQPPVGGMPNGVMNLVLVPLPFSLGAHSFEQALIEDVSGGRPGDKPKFGYFDLKQHWIEDDGGAGLIAFVDAVRKAAEAQCPAVHGFVFPELSLDYDTYRLVQQHLEATMPTAEILIGGISSDAHGRKGNFVAASTFPGHAAVGSNEVRQTVREKHHRWKLDQSQLRDYGLLGTLSPELSWWENISLQSRQVDFTVMRRDSVVAAMICEDLARVDPCQQIIRAVGPNLVIALHMDAPQVEARWPARYATVLADDPGCAVLTLTSRGLMTLQHRLGTFRSTGDDRVVAMWRDDGASKPIRLTCPYDAQAVLLTIVEQPVVDVALDGRCDGDAKAWRYAGSVPLRVANAKSEHGRVLGQEDMACW